MLIAQILLSIPRKCQAVRSPLSNSTTPPLPDFHDRAGKKLREATNATRSFSRFFFAIAHGLLYILLILEAEP
ncbi:MAG TPA: hypothetical protein DCZ89_08570 [Geobacter sulfurreducens]|nr:hypothetical protein [Geobacter sulfurreducens]HBG18061.1 hypothetical protein [Desulfobulbaceae bacterium]